MENVINENLQMTKIDLETYLQDHFAGKEFSQWSFANDVFNVIRALLPKEFADQLTMQYGDRSYGRQALGIKYGKGSACFIGVEVHKKMTKRGNNSSHWYYHTASEYTYGTFDIWWMDDKTLAQKMDEAIEQNNKLLGYAQDKERRAIDAVKLLMATYGLKDYEARELCSYIDKKWYHFNDKLKNN